MKRFGLSGSTLKIIACVLMLIDHVGSRLLPQYRILRIIGRLAFPIFAFLLAEGCRYTRNKSKHFGLIAGFGIVWECLLIYYYGGWEGNIFLTFTLSVLLIYLWQWAKRQCCGGVLCACGALVLVAAAVTAVWLLTEELHFEYRFWGIMAAPMAALFDCQEGDAPRWMKKLDCLPVKLALLTAALFFQAWPTIGRTVQIYALCAIPLLALYNGKPGIKKLKYAFYVFYPLHLMAIELIREWR